ncbi:unnamed protein product [Echinostoma caproni]|uniref:Uncharacterized protein n=1 Tax=Echinostoma caproni TaxID=27848 RepID=A0A183AF79_9TREM|nr:unnamed protein product [Echinostoma caproni]
MYTYVCLTQSMFKYQAANIIFKRDENNEHHDNDNDNYDDDDSHDDDANDSDDADDSDDSDYDDDNHDHSDDDDDAVDSDDSEDDDNDDDSDDEDEEEEKDDDDKDEEKAPYHTGSWNDKRVSKDLLLIAGGRNLTIQGGVADKLNFFRFKSALSDDSAVDLVS